MNFPLLYGLAHARYFTKTELFPAKFAWMSFPLRFSQGEFREKNDFRESIVRRDIRTWNDRC